MLIKKGTNMYLIQQLDKNKQSVLTSTNLFIIKGYISFDCTQLGSIPKVNTLQSYSPSSIGIQKLVLLIYKPQKIGIKSED